MKKRHFTAIAMMLITLFIFLNGCAEEKTPSVPEGEGGSDIAIIETTVTETTAAVTAPKYSESDKLIALTFDDGPHGQHTNRILDILEENNSTATFFVVGYSIEKNINTIRRAQALGCEIANHTNDHKNLTECNSKTLRNQVDTPNKKIKELTDTEMTLFRAPGGAFKGIKQDVGMPLIQWSIDTEDWKFKDASHPDRTEEERNADLKKIADDVIQKAQKGDIVLMHDIYNFTADLSEIIIPGLIENGFKIVSVSEMFEAYGKTLEDGVVYDRIKFPSETVSTTKNSDKLEIGTYKVKTSGGKLNIRIEPKQEGISIAQLSSGDTVKVIKSIKGWALVESSDACGWVNSSYLVK